MLIGTRTISTLLALFSVTGTVLAADLSTSVSGVVRDPHGTPQMGVLVELLRGSVVATAFTDLQGRYQLPRIPAGVYDLRTSATLFLPTLHRSLTVRAGTVSTVNLTLTGLFEETGWVALPHHSGKGDVEDWRWTLRSPANRPMLRVVDEDADLEHVPNVEAETSHASRRRAVLTTSTRSGGFGGTSELTMATGRQSADRRTEDSLLLSAGGFTGGASAPVMSAFAVHETGVGQGVERRVLLGVRSNPEIRTQGGAGLTVVELDSAERLEVGSAAAIEAGGQTQVLHAGQTLVAVHPFVRAVAHDGDVWLFTYEYATTPDSTGMDSFNGSEGPRRLPTVVDGASGLLTEAGSHQQCAASRKLGRARLGAAVFRDAEQRAALTGQMLHQNMDGSSLPVSGIAVDDQNGALRWLVPGATGTGFRAGVEMPFGDRGQITAAYLNAVGLSEGGAGKGSPAISPRRGSAMYVAVRQEIPATGTRIAASYRWQPASMLTTVGRYERSDVDPYLGLHLVQALPLGRSSGWHTELVVDATNVLAEGYRSAPELSPDVLLMSALREMRAGLAITF